MLGFLAFSGMWTYPAGHPEDPISFLPVTRHLGNLPSVSVARRSPRTPVCGMTLLVG